MLTSSEHGPDSGWRYWLWRIIFQADTPAGKAFDVILIIAIVTSVLTVMIESVATIRADYGPELHAIEWGFTGLFTIEYILRLSCVRRPLRYATSFLGIIDLLAILPTYLSLFLPGTEALMVVRFLRVLRIFRIFKLTEYLRESRVLTEALWAARRKIGVFLLAVLTLLTIVAALMYLIEGPENGYTDIPTSLYWAIVTLTTVGFGDIAPKTPGGRMLASCVMILGYGIIAVPTGIVTVELARRDGRSRSSRSSRETMCPRCFHAGHDADARYCKYCGSELAPDAPAETVPSTAD
ncbi:MAG: ion transporter [Gemmataceae bacterium]|nr:ion transporter [Gemmata sp.]MDW8198840.1 ion transporter [Gemmataceae bacterium]